MNRLMSLENPFNFTQGREIRTAIDERGEGWFCAKDVFETLDITWSGAGTSLKNMPEKWQQALYLTTSNGVKETIFISEPGVYKERPEGEKSRDWLQGLINGKKVIVRTVKDKKEKYGRYLAEIYLEGENVNDKMVAAGMAGYKEY